MKIGKLKIKKYFVMNAGLIKKRSGVIELDGQYRKNLNDITKEDLVKQTFNLQQLSNLSIVSL